MDPEKASVEPQITPDTHVKVPAMKWLGMLIAIALLSSVAAYIVAASQTKPTQKACTMEAKLCPDGSSVGRTGPNCEFSPCPMP